MCMGMSLTDTGSCLALTGESGRRWSLTVERVLDSGVSLVRDETFGLTATARRLVLKFVHVSSEQDLELMREETACWRACGMSHGDSTGESASMWRHIIQLEDTFIHEDPRGWFFAFLMEYGIPLIPEKANTEEKILRSVAHICGAMDAVLFSKGEGHGAIRLSNCYISDDGRVKLGGFGLTRALIARENQGSERADIFGLGVILYQLVFGRYPPEIPAAKVPINDLVEIQIPRGGKLASRRLLSLLRYMLGMGDAPSKPNVLELRYQIAAARGLVPPFPLEKGSTPGGFPNTVQALSSPPKLSRMRPNGPGAPTGDSVNHGTSKSLIVGETRSRQDTPGNDRELRRAETSKGGPERSKKPDNGRDPGDANDSSNEPHNPKPVENEEREVASDTRQEEKGPSEITASVTEEPPASKPSIAEVKKLSGKSAIENGVLVENKKAAKTLEGMLTKCTEPDLDPPSPRVVRSIVSEIRERKAASTEMYKVFHKKPISKEPVTAFKILLLLYISLFEGHIEFADMTRRQHQFLEWVEACWTKDRIAKKTPRKQHSNASCFAHGEIAIFSSFLLKKAAFHADNGLGLDARWKRSSQPKKLDGREARAVLTNLVPIVEDAEMLVAQVVASTDPCRACKLPLLCPLVADISKCYVATTELFNSLEVDDQRRSLPDFSACHYAVRSVMEAVRSSHDALTLVDPEDILQLEYDPPVVHELSANGHPEPRVDRRRESHTEGVRHDRKTENSQPRRRSEDGRSERPGDASGGKTDSHGDVRTDKIRRSDRLVAAIDKYAKPQVRKDHSNGSRVKKGPDAIPEDDEHQESSVERANSLEPETTRPSSGRRRKPRQGEVREPHVITLPAEDAAASIPEALGSGNIEVIDPAFEIHPSDIVLQEEIGRGGFGTVYKAKYHGRRVAVKKIHPQTVKSRKAIEEFQREIAVLCRLRHPNILLFMGACTRPPALMIVTEFMARGTLFDLLHRSNTRLSWKMIVGFALDVCRGVLYLHKNRLLHRDLKSSNMMMDDDMVVKVGDFGLTRPVSSTVSPMTGQTGTFQYMAPEVLSSRPYSEKADVYSFGILLWELVARRLPFFGLEPMQVGLAVVNERLRPNMPPECPSALSKIIRLCWDQDPHRRPNLENVMKLLEDAMPAEP